MSKLNCSNCKYYDFNAGEGVDWCKLNHEETGICGNCDREFEDLEEATTHYDAIVEENNTFLMGNSKMASEIKALQKQISDLEAKLAESEKKAYSRGHSQRDIANEIKLNALREDVANKEKRIVELKQQLAITEKALELACEPRDDWGGREYSGTEYDNYYDYFMAEAKEILENE